MFTIILISLGAYLLGMYTVQSSFNLDNISRKLLKEKSKEVSNRLLNNSNFKQYFISEELEELIFNKFEKNIKIELTFMSPIIKNNVTARELINKMNIERLIIECCSMKGMGANNCLKKK